MPRKTSAAAAAAAQPGVTPLGPVKVVPLGDVKAYGRNPRKIPAKAVEYVAGLIEAFGWQQPLVVDEQLVIIAGHVRHAAARHLQLAEVPVVIADQLTPEQARAFRVADNRSHDYTAWDYTALVEEIGALGEEFAPVLDLADWNALLQAFNEADTARDKDAAAQLPGTGYVVNVEFESKQAAEAAGPQLLAVPGVLDVRHSARNYSG